MSLKDDFLRNRKIFEMLAGSEDTVHETARMREEPLSPPVIEDKREQEPFYVFKNTIEKTDTFSLGRGKTSSRVTGMALSFSPPGGIDFPELSAVAAQSPADPLESLYHQLEVEARRSPQLSREEEF